MLSLILASALAAQSGSGFGWENSNWQRDFPSVLHEWVTEGVDFTGDGVNEIELRSYPIHQSFQILDGATGNTWFELSPPLGDVHSYLWQAEDLDGDGLPELILLNIIANAISSQIVVVHGGDGQVLWDDIANKKRDKLGESITFGDFNGDGFKDLFVHSNKGNRSIALNGSTGESLWRRSGQSRQFFATTPDLDGDGIADIFLGSDYRYTVLSGVSGQTIWNTYNTQLEDAEQWALQSSDVNLDGIDDLWVIHSSKGSGQNLGLGSIEVVDGASGLSLWSATGTKPGEQLGFGAILQDMNGDGVSDLLTRSPDFPSLLDGRTGALLWRRELAPGLLSTSPLVAYDFNRDGLLDLLATDWIVGNPGRSRLEILNGADGSPYWAVDSQLPKEDFTQLTLADFDLDGVLDVLAGSPNAETPLVNGGLLRLISGATGREIWQLAGAAVGSMLGGNLYLAEVDANPGPDLIALDLSASLERGRYAFSGTTGMELWRASTDPQGPLPSRLDSTDLNGDGLADGIERYWSSYTNDYTRFVAFDGENGQALWTLDFDSAVAPPRLIIDQINANGNGIGQLVFRVDESIGSYQLYSFSGSGDWWTTGLELNQSEVSVSNGGSINVKVGFPPTQAGRNYQLLLSETGNQLTDLGGLEVPLSRGFWLTSTYIGQYPNGMFSSPIGTLDDTGNAQITFDVLPNQIAPAYIGTTMYLAVISAIPGGPWRFSSGSAAVQILP
jgi:VCBS repeat protein/putative pyrroloquinoline-quinone binding quinoprotein